MSFLADLPLIGPTLAIVVPFVLVLSIVVFVHEFGHYIVGRWCGIGAEVFSIGFGRELFGWTDRRGTRWRVAALPLGGYVKFLGDVDAASSRQDDTRLSPEARRHSFHHASVGRRALTVMAGPLANFVLSIAIFAAVALTQGRAVDAPVIGAISADINPEFARTLAPGDRVIAVDGVTVRDFAGLQAALLASDGARVPVTLADDKGTYSVDVVYRPPARVDGVVPGSAADLAGLVPGDVIAAIDGVAVDGFSDLQRRTRASDGATMQITVRRGTETLALTITPQMTGTIDPLTGDTVMRPMLGIQKQASEIMPVIEGTGPLGALASGASRTWAIIDLSLSGIADMISGRQNAREVLGGPIRIAEVSGQAAGEGLGTFVALIAVLSTSIGLINLFPIPVLDGGHLMFYAIERLRGRPLRDRWMEIGNGIGLGLVLLLMVFATLNDLARL